MQTFGIKLFESNFLSSIHQREWTQKRGASYIIVTIAGRGTNFCLLLVLSPYLACQQRHQEARLFPHVLGSCPPYSAHPSDCPFRVANCQTLHLCHLSLKAKSRESLPSIKKDNLSHAPSLKYSFPSPYLLKLGYRCFP